MMMFGFSRVKTQFHDHSDIGFPRQLFGLEDVLMGGLGDDSTTEQSAIHAYLGTGDVSLPHHRPQSRRLPLGVVAIIAQGALQYLPIPLSSASH
jgi:hypothetical protein